MRVQTSLNGRPIPIIYGAQRIPANLIWYGDFVSQTQQQQSGGKGLGGGGGKGSTKSYVYYAAVAAALCEGPIVGLGHVWDSQGQLALVSTTQTFTVPVSGGGVTVTPPGGGVFYRDLGPSRADAYSVGPFTDYGSSGPTTLTGTQQTPMAPVDSLTGAGQYTLNPATGLYTFHSADAGKVMTITYIYSVPNSAGNGQPATTLSLTLFTGARPQTAWSYLSTKHPSQALGYNGLAYVANGSLFLGSSGQLPNLSYEVHGFLMFGAGIPDCNPSAAIRDFLTSPVYGAGFSSTYLADWSNFSNYCVANGLFLSLVLDQHETAAGIIQRVMDITNSECVWTGSTLKAIPYGDTTVVGNGVTFTPNTTPLYDLNDDDFISPDQGDPVKLKIGTVIDANNSVTVEYTDRSNQYNASLVEAKDDASINLFGLRKADPESWHEITTQKVAALAADLLLRRKVYVRNVYTFTLSWRYGLLEPMDMVTITDATLGLNKAPVRIISISEDDKGNLAIEAEEFPWGTATPTLYPKEPNAGATTASMADPGNVNTPVIFEANNRITEQQGYQLWMALSGASANWGGCSVWLSTDNATYKQIGKIYGAARMGTLTTILPVGTDPDTTDTLAVDLTQSLGALLSGTAADADSYRTLCYVDGELISYQTATLTAAYKYNLTTRLRRGVFGTTIGSHAVGSLFARLDDAIFKWQYDPTLINQTLYLKFTSFNTSQNMEQPLSAATAYLYTPLGSALGLLTPAHASYRPLSNPLVSSDNGTNPVVTVSAFTMRVAGVDIPIAAGSVSATAGDYGKTAFIYYDDPGFAGGAVAFNLTFTREVALAYSARFFVGSIALPVSGGGSRIGNNDGGAGGQYSKQVRLLPTVATVTGTWTNQNNALDDDPSTYASASSSTANATFVASGYPNFSSWFTGNTLNVLHQVTAIGGGGTVVLEYSLNGGTTWMTLRSVTAVDAAPFLSTVVVPLNTNANQVQVRFTLPGGTGTSTTVTNYAGTGADDAVNGTIAWTNPTNAQGNQTALFAVASNPTANTLQNSNYLKLTNFGFAIPAGATINGILATATIASNFFDDGVGNYKYTYDASVKLYKAGVLVGTNHAGVANWPSTIGTETFGGSTDLWGTTWTLTDINNSGFGIGISATMENGGTKTGAYARIYSVAVTVYYTTSTGSPSSTTRIYDLAQVVVF